MDRDISPTPELKAPVGKTLGTIASTDRPTTRKSSTRSASRPRISSGSFLLRWPAFGLLAALAAGCHHGESSHYTSVAKPPTVRIIRPEARTIVRVVGQPSFVEAFEQTSVYAKLPGFIEKWNVDIGDKVKKGEVLATLFIPELVEDFETKKATVKLDEEKIELARKMVDVADADVKAAVARLGEAKAILNKYHAEVERWNTEVKRLENEVKRGVVDPQILLESTNQWKSSLASLDAAQATIAKAEAELLSRQASYAKAKVDVAVAQADLSVASSEAKRLEALVGYTTLPAPFDGIVTARNANTFDFVLPATGDSTANQRSPNISSSGAAPIYVVDRTDIVRIFVDIPEQDANYVNRGTKASVLVKGYRDEPIPGQVTRTSWALNIKSRTLRAEIDLPNPNSRLLPNMYAYAKVRIERPGVLALPVAALTYSGEKTFCWTYQDGNAVRTEIRTGVTDGDWIEVTNLQSAVATKDDHPWRPINGKDKIILGDLSTLVDGGPVDVLTGEEKAQVAGMGSRNDKSSG